jgi:serine/threonine-protein kinase
LKQCPTCGQQFEDNVKFCPDDASQLIVVGEDRMSDPFLGVVLGTKYRIEDKIGEGGMGKIYLARHVTLKKRYAVKMLNTEFSKNQEAVERFRREATTAGELDHPNIINITDIDYTEDGHAYIVMEFLEGRELRDDLMKSPVLPADRLVRIITQVCRALDAAHARGIVHRDLKPENIFLVDLPDQPDTVKLLDFGISKIKTGGDTNLTQTGMVIGTPHYMAPEQAKGDRDIDHRADIFAIGAMLYEACTGQVPATGDTATAILMKILLEEPPPPRQLNPELPPEVEAVILRAMQKDREARFQSCNELAEALQAATGIGMSIMSGMSVPSFPTAHAQQPPGGGAPQGYGTAQTPMSWDGAPSTASTPSPVEKPRKKGGMGALIAIPLVLLLVLVVGGGAVGAMFALGVFSGGSGGGEGEPVGEKASTSPAPDEPAGDDSAATVASGTPEPDEEDGQEAVDEAGEGKVKIRFSTDPEGADVMLKIGSHTRDLCTSTCTHEFNESDKTVTVLLSKKGYRDQELEFQPDFNKELVTKLYRKGSKKRPPKDTAPVVKDLTQPGKPSWEIKPKPKPPKHGGGKKPIIKPITKPKKGGGSSGGKKPPPIKIIKSPKG